MKGRMLVALGATIASMLFAVPAQAVTTDLPEVQWAPQPNTPTGWTFQIEGPRRAWGTRVAARQYDQMLDEIRVKRWGTCAENPTAICIKVEVDNYGDTGWSGLYTPQDLRYDALIQYNTYYGRARIGCHEFSHALGLDHHRSPGCLNSAVKYPSVQEVEAVRSMYAAIRSGEQTWPLPGQAQ